MSEWTPSAEQVRSHYVFDQSDRWDAERGEQFDRWLAAEKAKWQAEAKRVAWNVGFVCGVAYQSGDNEAWRNPYAKGSDDDR